MRFTEHTVTIEGTTPLIFTHWREGGREHKLFAPDLVDYADNGMARTGARVAAISAAHLLAALADAAALKRDPRGYPRSARRLCQTTIRATKEMAALGNANWDFGHRPPPPDRGQPAPVCPAIHPGWRATFTLAVPDSGPVSGALLREFIQTAGNLIGLGEYRPSYGRFFIQDFRSEAGKTVRRAKPRPGLDRPGTAGIGKA